MALLIDARDVKQYFKLDSSVSEYIFNAVNKDSNIYRRILNLCCANGRVEQKFDLGNGVMAIEQSYKLGDGGIFESHKKYVDFQLIINGSECMKIGFPKCFRSINAYDDSKDMINYNVLKNISSLSLYEGDLLVLFPDDIHAGGFKLNDNIVFKSVLKVPLSLLRS